MDRPSIPAKRIHRASQWKVEIASDEHGAFSGLPQKGNKGNKKTDWRFDLTIALPVGMSLSNLQSDGLRN
jgi:hypothetical protein